MKLFTLPNVITLLNLLCGCLAIVCAFNGELMWSAYLVGIAAVLDFLDGFVARALKQYSPIGKDLDSLADMVTFGVVPGVVMFHLIRCSISPLEYSFPHNSEGYWKMAMLMPAPSGAITYLPYVAFLIPLFSALRLAKFNNDTRQTDSFIGVPTPANSIFVVSLVLIGNHHFGYFSSTNPFQEIGEYVAISMKTDVHTTASAGWLDLLPYILCGLTLVLSFLLISEIPLFALKVKGFGWKGNEIRYIFLALSLVMLVLLKFIALPLIIVLYVLMSVVNNLMRRKEKQL